MLGLISVPSPASSVRLEFVAVMHFSWRGDCGVDCMTFRYHDECLHGLPREHNLLKDFKFLRVILRTPRFKRLGKF